MQTRRVPEGIAAILGTVTTLAMNALTAEPRRDGTEVTNVISALVFDGLRA